MTIPTCITAVTHTVGRATVDLQHSYHSHILPVFGSNRAFSCRLCAQPHSITSLIRLQVGMFVRTDMVGIDAVFEADLYSRSPMPASDLPVWTFFVFLIKLSVRMLVFVDVFYSRYRGSASILADIGG